MTDFADLPVEDFTVPDTKASRDERFPDEPTSGGFSAFARRAASTKDTPKRTRTPRARTVEPPSKPGEFVEPVEKFYVVAGITLSPIDPPLGYAIAQQASDCAKAWDNLAQKNPGVRRVLRSLTTASVWGALIAAHAPILSLAVMRHTPVKDKLTARMGPGMADQVEAWLMNLQQQGGEPVSE